MIGLVIIAFIILLAALAGRYGVDSRDGSIDPRRAQYPVGIH